MVKDGAQRLRAAADDLVALQTRENGKPLADSRRGVEAGIGAVEQYAELGPLHRGRSLQGGWDSADWMRRVSRGVAALCLPWNDSVALAAHGCFANAGQICTSVEHLHGDVADAFVDQLVSTARAYRVGPGTDPD